jgi:uncharacterized membrane protein YgcG
MPASYELFGDYVLMCHPIPGFGSSLPRMCVENEKVLVNGLLKELNSIFKWNLDTDPTSLRELDKPSDHLLQAPVNHTDAVIIGGSNGKRLHEAMSDFGMRVNGLTSGGWTLSRAAVDSLLPILEEQLAFLPESVPVVLYLLDNSCFRAINENGDLVAITRSEDDGLFHVLGDLADTPFSLLRNLLQELDRLIAACGNRHILILGALPCFFLKTCCDNFSHCANISRHDETQDQRSRSAYNSYPSGSRGGRGRGGGGGSRRFY